MTDAVESAHRVATAQLIRSYYEAFNRGDSAGMLAFLTDDVIHDVNQGERRQGIEKFRAFNARMDHHYKEQLKDIVVMVSKDGNRASAEFNVHGVYKNTDEGLPPAKGQTYVLPAGTFFAIRDGKIARVTTYYNLTDWIAQVAPEMA
ncbi:MAG: ketosteroid isomerase-related protein [Hyphomicrobium sp.]|nr:ketosteroid isomerase-related protein [Hyphomicrobium sp.]